MKYFHFQWYTNICINGMYSLGGWPKNASKADFDYNFEQPSTYVHCFHTFFYIFQLFLFLFLFQTRFVKMSLSRQYVEVEYVVSKRENPVLNPEEWLNDWRLRLFQAAKPEKGGQHILHTQQRCSTLYVWNTRKLCSVKQYEKFCLSIEGGL